MIYKKGQNLAFKTVSYNQDRAHKLSDPAWKIRVVNKGSMPVRSAQTSDPRLMCGLLISWHNILAMRVSSSQESSVDHDQIAPSILRIPLSCRAVSGHNHPTQP